MHLHGEDYRAGVDIHTVVLIDRASLCQGLHGLLVEEFPHGVVFPVQEHAVVLSGFHVLLEGYRRRAPAGKVDLQWIEQQEHISGEEQHPLPDPGRNRGHDDEEFVKEGGRAAVRELVGYRAEQLAQGRIGGDALAVAAGMDYQDAKVVEMAVAALDFLLFIDVADHRQGGSARAHTDASFIRDHCEVGGCGKVIPYGKGLR